MPSERSQMRKAPCYVALFTWCFRKRQDYWSRKTNGCRGLEVGEGIGVTKQGSCAYTCTHMCTHTPTHARTPRELRHRARLWGSSLTPRSFQGTIHQEKMWADCCGGVGMVVFKHFKLCPLASRGPKTCRSGQKLRACVLPSDSHGSGIAPWA